MNAIKNARNPRAILRFFVVTGVAMVAVSGCATRTLDQCNPNDASFTDLFMCRDQYGVRSERLQDEARQRADSAEQSEMDLDALEQARADAEKKLDRLKEKITQNQSRIDQLKESNSATESELSDLQELVNEIQMEEEELRKAQLALQNKQDSDELEDKLESLAEKEAELETLLLALESV